MSLLISAESEFPSTQPELFSLGVILVLSPFMQSHRSSLSLFSTTMLNDIFGYLDTFLQWLHSLFWKLSFWLPICRKADRVYLAFSQRWKLLIKAENMMDLRSEVASLLSAAPFPLWRWEDR